MARTRSHADVVPREYEALRRDVEYLGQRHRRGELEALTVVAQRIVDGATRWAGDLDPRVLTSIAERLVAVERPLDAALVLEASLARFHPSDVSGPASWTRRLLVDAAEESGRFASAIAAGDALLPAPWLAADDRIEIHLLVAEAERQVGRIERAAVHLGHADALLAALPVDDRTVETRTWVQALWGVLARTAGELIVADTRFRAALGSEHVRDRALVLALAADALADQEHVHHAARLLDEADHLPADRATTGTVALVRGRVLADAGDLAEASEALAQAESALAMTQRMPLVARTHHVQARVLLAQGRLEEGRSQLVRARDALAAMGCEREVAAIDAELGPLRDRAPG